MRTSRYIRVFAAVTLFYFLTAGTGFAASLILNGGFESGFASWIRVNQLGSDGTFFLQSGTVSPVSLDSVPAPPGGTIAAMTDALGPGSHVMYQDFVVPSPSAALSFSLFVGNRANAFATPATLDFSTPVLNQQARVDILKAGTDPFSVSSSDVLMNLYQTKVGDPLISGYNSFNFNLSPLFSANIGQTLRLRFAETDNVFTFQFGVDNVSLESPALAPEPSSLVSIAAGLLVLLGLRRLR